MGIQPSKFQTVMTHRWVNGLRSSEMSIAKVNFYRFIKTYLLLARITTFCLYSGSSRYEVPHHSAFSHKNLLLTRIFRSQDDLLFSQASFTQRIFCSHSTPTLPLKKAPITTSIAMCITYTSRHTGVFQHHYTIRDDLSFRLRIFCSHLHYHATHCITYTTVPSQTHTH